MPKGSSLPLPLNVEEVSRRMLSAGREAVLWRPATEGRRRTRGGGRGSVAGRLRHGASDLGTSPAGPCTRLRLEWGWNPCLSSQSLVPTPQEHPPGDTEALDPAGPLPKSLFLPNPREVVPQVVEIVPEPCSNRFQWMNSHLMSPFSSS